MEERLQNVAILDELLAAFPALKVQPSQPAGNVHCYYQYPVFYDSDIAGIHRDKFTEALKAEIPSAVLRETAPLISNGYVKPLYLAPIYQQKAAWAFNAPQNEECIVDYAPGRCPIAEDMHFNKLFALEYMRPGLSRDDIKDVANAIEKIFDNKSELKC